MANASSERVVAVRKPPKQELGVINSPRELGPPVLRKALPAVDVTVHAKSVTPPIAERAAGMSQNVLVKKFRDMLG